MVLTLGLDKIQKNFNNGGAIGKKPVLEGKKANDTAYS